MFEHPKDIATPVSSFESCPKELPRISAAILWNGNLFHKFSAKVARTVRLSSSSLSSVRYTRCISRCSDIKSILGVVTETFIAK